MNNINYINANYMYSLADNCVLRIGGHGQIISKFGKDIEETSDMAVDQRMSIVSYGSTRDLTEYFKYFYIVSVSAAKKLAVEEFMKGNFVAMLDNGFVPFYMPPTYMPAEMGEQFKTLIKTTGIKFIEEKAMRFDGLTVDSQANDIWISRPEAADFLSKSLGEFNTLEFIKEVWSRARN